MPTKKRPNPAKPKSKAKRAKKGEPSHDDSLSNITVPKYNYNQLDVFMVRGRNNVQNTQWYEEFNGKPIAVEPQPYAAAVEPQPSPADSHNYSIEESSSMDENGTQNSNSNDNNIRTVSDSCVERTNLLNQDNTLFLDINTQLLCSVDSVTNQVNAHSTSTAANIVQPNSVVPELVALSSTHGDRTEFLYYVEILNLASNIKNIMLPSGERAQQLNIEATLQHQCNGNNRIVVNDDAIKLILKLTDKEWQATQIILAALSDFRYDARNTEPIGNTIIHRAVHYLFRTVSKISNVHISYGDQDLETARVFHKPNNSNENLTSAIDPFVLLMMKAKANELNE